MLDEYSWTPEDWSAFYVTCLHCLHQYEVMKRHDERMQMRNLIPEATKRTYGRRYENPTGAYRLV